MRVTVNGKEYSFISNAIDETKYRESYFNLVDRVFGLDFKPWYLSGFCKGSFIPYTLFEGDAAVSTVGVVINDFTWHEGSRKYIQISTVATDPDHRCFGLSKWLTETVLNEWQSKCDCIYLYANDSVLDFYPKFGFIPVEEYLYYIPIKKTVGECRKIDLSVQNDVDILINAYNKSNPFSLFKLLSGLDLMMFHCITFLRDHIYYIEEYDAVVIARLESNELFCYDIFTDKQCSIRDILGIIASDDTTEATLGFTPSDEAGYAVDKADEDDTTVFVMSRTENIFLDSKITLPFLSRA